MEEIKVSVIVPVYNTENYLVECIDSICNQTLREIEILLVNDESTDGSLAILERYAKQDCRVRVIQNVHEGGGAGSARNTGLKEAKGKYLSFLDSDDYFDLTMLEKAWTRAESYSLDAVLFDACEFQNQTNSILMESRIPKKLYPKQNIFSAYDFPTIACFAFPGVTWQYIFRREFILDQKLMFQKIFFADDLFFIKTAVLSSKKISMIDEVLVYHRMHHAESQYTNFYKESLNIPISFLEIKEKLKQKGLFDEVKNGYALNAIGLLNILLSQFPTYESFSILFDALSNEYIEKLELRTSITEDLLPFDAFAWLDMVQNNKKSEYLFQLLQQQKRQIFCFETEVLFPANLVQKEDKVIIYGAGNIGTGFFVQNLQENYCQLVGWVDKNASDKQYPIEGLEILQTRKCDKVIVAIDSEVVFQAVQSYLLDIGFQKEQIIYGIQS